MGSTEELFTAIDAGDADLVRSLVSAEPVLASGRDAQGVSVLMRAKYRSSQALVDAVLAADPPIDVFEAAALGAVERLRGMLDRDPALAIVFAGDGFTALHLTAFFGEVDAARLLVDRGADVDAHGRGWMTGTALNSAAAGRHTDVARLLLDAGADVDARQASGWTSLHASAHNGSLELVDLLLSRGADPAATNDDGASAISLADEAGHPQIVAHVRSAMGGNAVSP
jgi:ankyrin repeat protein